MADVMVRPRKLHLPYEAAPFRMALGVTALREPDWIEIDDAALVQIAERRRLLAGHRAEVLAALPGTEPLCIELRELIEAHLRAYHPGWIVPARDENDHPLAAIGHQVAEDFCLLEVGPEGPRLVAALLCFPSRWRLADKIGRPMLAIHKPVPTYAETLGRPVDRFLGALKPGRLAMRLNWSIHEEPTLFQPGGHEREEHDASITAENAGDRLWLRVERQTFRLLPVNGTIVFGIRSHVTPLGEVTALPGEAARLAAAVRGIPPELERYKSLRPFRGALLDYLDRQCGTGSDA
jgi:dimethylamine monooxygenase subunit A